MRFFNVMQYKKKLFLLYVLLGFGAFSKAQETFSAAGNEASGSGGTVSFSIGQVTYMNFSGTNGLINQGVQNAYEISTVGVSNNKDIVLSLSVYPNPANENICLKIESENFENLNYQLYDQNGKLVLNQKINSRDISIPIYNLANATYFLKVCTNNAELKNFKIIKSR